MPKYIVLCPSCNSEFASYEKYISHVFEKHKDQPSLRMRAKVIRKEINQGSSANRIPIKNLKENDTA
ncbi:MAG: hypothetical protein WA323_16060 [Candidatus Nitrosopolaris sp.]